MIVNKTVQIIKHCYGVHIRQQSPQKWKSSVSWSVNITIALRLLKEMIEKDCKIYNWYVKNQGKKFNSPRHNMYKTKT